MNTRPTSREITFAPRIKHTFLLRVALFSMVVLSALVLNVIVAAHNLSVRVVCGGKAVPNAEVTLIRVKDKTPWGRATTDEAGAASIRDFDRGIFELKVTCPDGTSIVHEFATGDTPNFSHLYTFRCCPPDKGHSGLISVDDKPPTAFQGVSTKTTPPPQNTTATNTPTPSPANASAKTAGGLTTVTFLVDPGRIKVYLPDDMRAGDTISGTVIAEPNGKTKEEQTANQAELKKFGIRLIGTMDEKPQDVALGDITSVVKFALINDRPAGNVMSVGIYLVAAPTSIVNLINLPLTPSGAVVTPDPKITPPAGMTESGAVITPDPKTKPPFYFPLTGQTGHPIVITGPFDGDAANTSVNFRTDRNIDWDKVKSTMTDFEKPSQSVFGGFGLIAESPRKAVFEAPPNVVGAVEVLLKEGPTEKIGEFRNLRLDLTAPKTSLLKGESTELKVQVTGLSGLTQPVPLTLTSEGVITMDGGPFQQLMIEPKQVDKAGQFTTFRRVTGIQAGGWGATATVVTHPYNFCLQDDTDPNRLFHFNSFTGNYVFACGGGSCGGGAGGTSSQPPTGSSVPPPPVTLTGIGKSKMKGCIITLTHNAPDRRVFARLDACTKTGDASVETTSPKTTINITDKNTADNAVASPPPK